MGSSCFFGKVLMFACHVMLPPRRFILMFLIILIALLSGSLTQAQSTGKVYLAHNRYDFVRIQWDHIINDVETDLEPTYRAYLNPVKNEGWSRAIIGH